jgi:hypothetical protein
MLRGLVVDLCSSAHAEPMSRGFGLCVVCLIVNPSCLYLHVIPPIFHDLQSVCGFLIVFKHDSNTFGFVASHNVLLL